MNNHQPGANEQSTTSVPSGVQADPMAELEVLKFKRSWLAVSPHLLLAAIVGWACFRLTLAFPETISATSFSFFGETYTISIPLLFFVTLGFLVRPLALMFDERYELGRHHARATHGRISWTKLFVEVPYEDLLTVEVEQSILDRILTIGTVIAGSAMTDKPSIYFYGVRRPRRIAKEITRRIDMIRQLDHRRSAAS